VLQRLARDAGLSEEIVRQLGNLGSTIAQGMFDFLHRFIDLAKTNPFWGAALGVLVVDLMTHKVNWVAWTHEEQQWQQIDPSGNVLAAGFMQAYDWLTGSKAGMQLVNVTVPGVISSTCAITITGLVLTGWGIGEAGAILGDVTQFTKIAGNSNPTASLMTPTLTTLVEAGAAAPIALPVSKPGVPAGVA